MMGGSIAYWNTSFKLGRFPEKLLWLVYCIEIAMHVIAIDTCLWIDYSQYGSSLFSGWVPYGAFAVPLDAVCISWKLDT